MLRSLLLLTFFVISTTLTFGLLMVEEEEKSLKIELERAEGIFAKGVPVPDLIRSYGYPVEEHFVTTADGYILSLHRIPRGRRNSIGRNRPVFLGHCLVGSSAVFSFGPPDHSLSYLLADEGFDVWMPNMRGNSYSKNHTQFETCSTCQRFWEFGFQESALFDYPASIDYILETTGHQDLYFVGYSMGTTQYLIMLSDLPEYNDKVKAGFLFGPTAFAGNISLEPVLRLADHADGIKYVFDLFRIYEFLPNFLELKSWIAHSICEISSFYSKACRDFFSIFLGMKSERINSTMVPVYMSHLPSGSSTIQFLHYAQLFRNGGHFRHFDFGVDQNRIQYGSDIPPDFDLSRITVPTALFTGVDDVFATPKDSDKLAEILPNVIVNEVIDDPHWTHMDFVWNMDVKEMLYDKVIGMMLEMERL